MQKMNAPPNVVGCSFAGVEYRTKKGAVNVPEEAIQALLEHGFAIGGEPDQADEQPAEASAEAPAETQEQQPEAVAEASAEAKA